MDGQIKTRHYFLIFPESEDSIMQFSLEKERINNLIKGVQDLVKSGKVYYDAINVKTFLSQIRDLADFKIDDTLKLSMGRTAKNFRAQGAAKQKGDIEYFAWLLEKSQVEPVKDTLLAEIPEMWKENEYFLIIDFDEKYKSKRQGKLTIFKDALHLTDLPAFFKIDFVNDFEEALLWNKKHANGFSLLDRNRFERISVVVKVKGALVYREIKTGKFWYLDTFHKDEYEVFDKTGNEHLGTASLDGVFSETKKDSKKKLKF